MKLTESKFWKDAKQVKERGLIRTWLVWTIGTYANGLPWIELRAIYTDEKVARMYAKEVSKYECKQGVPGGMWRDRVQVEPRVINHLYADEMKHAFLSTNGGAFAE